MKTSYRKQGFTLVELLVVISIIAILVSLVLPVLASSKHKARAILCASNLMQTSIDFCVSLGDDPGGTVWLNDGSGEYFNPKSPQTQLCPEASILTDSTPDYFGSATRAYQFNTRISSYSYNWYMLGLTYWSPDSSLESMIQQTSEMPAFFDGTFIYADPTEIDLPATDLFLGTQAPYGSGVGMASINIPRHGSSAGYPRNWPQNQPLQGAINIVFFDGHVKQTKLDDLWFLKWSPDWQNPARRPGL
jgi:prepilin-type N-terminal cleavage/methylation domain-containing protein/prepilin-type processing-associated H-X9-DG protein